jgi:hypothetical protein
LVKRVVDLNGLEIPAIIGQESTLGEVLRIKRASPVIVLPPRRSDMDIFAISHKELPFLHLSL